MSWDRQVDDDRVLRQNFGQQIKKIVENEFRDKLKIEKEAEEMRQILKEIRSLAAKRFWLFPFSRTMSAIIAKCDQALEKETSE
jgi:hypothetical protein